MYEAKTSWKSAEEFKSDLGHLGTGWLNLLSGC